MKNTNELQKLERAVTAYVLNDQRLYNENADLFNHGIICNDSTCQKVINAFKAILSEGLAPDAVNISEKSGVDLIEVSDLFSIDFNFDFRNSLQALVISRSETELLSLTYSLQNGIKNGFDLHSLVNQMKSYVNQAENLQIERLITMKESLQVLNQRIKERQTGIKIGIRTGLERWDKHCGGLHPSDLIVIAAETSQGKTSLAITIAFNTAILSGTKVVFFSYEMSTEQLTARFASIETGVPGKSILFKKLGQEELEKVNNIYKLIDAQIFIDDCRSVNIDYLLSGIRSAHMRYGVQVVIIDYIQLVKDPEKRNEETEIASNTRRLKNIAKELNINIIILSQLSRDRNNPKPSMSRMRGSGQIEEAADMVVLIWRPEIAGLMYEDAPISSTENTAEIIFAKGRNIGTGRMWLNYNPQLTCYYDCNYD